DWQAAILGVVLRPQCNRAEQRYQKETQPKGHQCTLHKDALVLERAKFRPYAVRRAGCAPDAGPAARLRCDPAPLACPSGAPEFRSRTAWTALAAARFRHCQSLWR